MGFWDKVKESANKIAESESWAAIKETASNVGCKVGVHSGKPQHVEGQPQCYMEYTCDKCNQLIIKQKHKFPSKSDAKYHSFRSCDKRLKCEYCDAVETVTVHEHWNSKGVDGYCNNVEKCARCHTERKNGKHHSFIRRGTQGSKIVVECINCRHTELKDTWN